MKSNLKPNLKSNMGLSQLGIPVGISLAFLVMACNTQKQGRVYFGNLTDGAQIESPVTIEMKAENLVVEPATNGVNEGKGHFHILVDRPMVPSPNPIPKDAQHIHYGKGDTVAVLELSPGPHTLILQFAKGDHVSYDPAITQEIKVTVKAPAMDLTDSANTVMGDSTKPIPE